MEKLKSIAPASVLDVQGLACPHPIMLVKKEMEKLTPGSLLKVLCDSAETAGDAIPRYCEKKNFVFEIYKTEDNGFWEIYILKK